MSHPYGSVERVTDDKRVCWCRVCAQRKVRANHRCSACYQYLRRNGYDRSVAMTDRQRDRELKIPRPGHAITQVRDHPPTGVQGTVIICLSLGFQTSK